METENLTTNPQLSILQRTLSAAVPVLLIAIGYIDPGKWASAVEGGACFGFDLVTLLLVFNFAAILCQYLSARIAVITGKDLAQICCEEFDKVTCIFLGVQAEVSMFTLDLNLILGTAHGLNLMFGVDLFACVFLTAVDAALFPIFATLLENGKSKVVCIFMASFILLLYIFGALISQPEIPLSAGGMLMKLSGESAFALMSLLGANIIPHNFYLHSSIVQQNQEPTSFSKEALCHDHFFAIVCMFSGIFLVNYVVLNSAANVFYSAELGFLTFQDALSLMDQVFRSPIAPFALTVILFFSHHITALTWNIGRQAVLQDFFKMDIPVWLHHTTIRIIAIIPALYCVWNSGAEGIYQLLIFTQVMVATLLPSSVIPLFRVASARSVMGAQKIPQLLEFLAWIMFVGMLGLNIIFMVEMVFGNSDWVTNLRWGMGSSMPFPYALLLFTAFFSFVLMLWLAATPMKSASPRLDAQVLNWDMQTPVHVSSVERSEIDLSDSGHHAGEELLQKEDPASITGKPSEPEALLNSETRPHLTPIDEDNSGVTLSSTSTCHPEESAVLRTLGNVNAPKAETTGLVEKSQRTEGGKKNERCYERNAWESEDSSKVVHDSSPILTSEDSGSFKNIGKSDDLGSGTGSLSRLAGLGRAARRQLTAVLDEFWGQLFDFHGQATEQAKAKKLDKLLGIDSKLDSKPASASLTVDTNAKELMGYLPSIARGSDAPVSSNLYGSPKNQRGQSDMELTCGVQRGTSSLWSSRMQLLDAFAQHSSHNALDSSERRYSSMRIPQSCDGYDQQPATIHGYQFASYLNRVAKERGSDPSLVSTNCRDTAAPALVSKLREGLSNMAPPGFSNHPMPRSSMLPSERPHYDLSFPEATESAGSTVNAKKFYSLPDISGLSIPLRDSLSSERSAQRDSSMKYGSSAGQTRYDRCLYSNVSRAVTPSAFDEVSPKVYRDAFSIQFSSSSGTGSLWSRQPFEQFGVADKTHLTEGEAVGRQTSLPQDIVSSVDAEGQLLQSFRHCVVKLLKLEGSDWLFKQNDGPDEDLMDHVAARERLIYEAETREMNRVTHIGDSPFFPDRKPGTAPRNDDTENTRVSVTSVPNCGEGCIWRVDLIVSFGVWCIRRILELSLVESRPELWGKYTYVLNRLQGVIDLAFSKPHSPMTPCFCLQIPVAHQQRSSPPVTNGNLPPPVKQCRGKCTNAAMLIDLIKDVEIAISFRKGRTGTAAGDVAFPKGKENLASVLKRYKRRLSNKPIGTHEGGPASRKVPISAALSS